MSSNQVPDGHSVPSEPPPPRDGQEPSQGAKKAASFKRARKIGIVRKKGRKVTTEAFANIASCESLDPHQSILDDSYESSQEPAEILQAPISPPAPPPQPLGPGGIHYDETEQELYPEQIPGKSKRDHAFHKNRRLVVHYYFVYVYGIPNPNEWDGEDGYIKKITSDLHYQESHYRKMI